VSGSQLPELPDDFLAYLQTIDLYTNPNVFNDKMLKHQMELVNKEIAQLVEELGADAIELAEHFTELDSIDMEQFSVPLQSIPIRCDVRTLPWKVFERIFLRFHIF